LAVDLMLPVTVLVVAKAPVSGVAKTRLGAALGTEAAAQIAAAALLDTLDAVAGADVSSRVVAMTGDLDAASHAAEIRRCLAGFTVIPQRGSDFADRLANAHADAAITAGPQPILQIGMDTPQVTAGLITRCAETLLSEPAVLGMAADGGWWVIGVRSPTTADVLRGVPMSRDDTGAVTLRALRDTGISVALVDELHDVDTVDDVAAVRDFCAPESRFAQLTRAMGI
jgi:rSAM/selenodomain-associated transferase 1